MSWRLRLLGDELIVTDPDGRRHNAGVIPKAQDGADVIAHLTPYLSAPDDDLHAMAVLGLVICGENPDISRCMDIADLSPTPETYHATAVAQMAQLIDPE